MIQYGGDKVPGSAVKFPGLLQVWLVGQLNANAGDRYGNRQLANQCRPVL